MEFHEYKFDTRVIRRNLRRKVMTKEEHNAYLKALPDSCGVAVPINGSDRSEEAPDASGAKRRRAIEAAKHREFDDD
jgi:hypothetical protein